MYKRKTLDQFIKQAKEIHGIEYDYSLVEYKNARTKVKIVCPKHGIFEQTPDNHINKEQKCPYCFGNMLSNSEEFIKKCKKKYGNKYDYSLVEYINNYTKVKIICPEHGEFETTPQIFLKSSYGCIYCYRDKRRKTREQFIIDSKKIHNDKYDYSLVEYINSITKVKIICPIHGIFEQKPNTHLSNKGCPLCHDITKIEYKKLYILYDNKINLYKIGYSKNVEKRVKQIESFLRYNIDIINIYDKMAKFEKDIHDLYFEKRKQHTIKHGGYMEWYDLNNIDIVNINKIFTMVYN